VQKTLPATSDCESPRILQHSNCSYSPHHCRKVHALSCPFPDTFETHLCCHCLRTIAWILLQLLLPQHCCTWQQHVCKLQNKLSLVQTSKQIICVALHNSSAPELLQANWNPMSSRIQNSEPRMLRMCSGHDTESCIAHILKGILKGRGYWPTQAGRGTAGEGWQQNNKCGSHHQLGPNNRLCGDHVVDPQHYLYSYSYSTAAIDRRSTTVPSKSEATT